LDLKYKYGTFIMASEERDENRASEAVRFSFRTSDDITKNLIPRCSASRILYYGKREAGWKPSKRSCEIFIPYERWHNKGYNTPWACTWL